ncbi:hypothetical protein ABZ840_22500 [Streptomyces sp. NPDC047117]|uniref:WapI family immunity protein n=1 Tax=unclassified Streptomyces TaxID=2593676 RepID=UPI0033F67B84
MLLTDGASRIALRPLRYQFPGDSGDTFDDNWLVVAAEVTTPEGAWSFTDPCLLTDEARELSGWLRAVAAGRVADTDLVPDPDGDLEPGLAFLEPDLAFSQVRWRDGKGLLRVHLSLTAVPPWRRDDEDLEVYRYGIEVATDRAAVLRAAEEWERLLLPFPKR